MGVETDVFLPILEVETNKDECMYAHLDEAVALLLCWPIASITKSGADPEGGGKGALPPPPSPQKIAPPNSQARIQGGQEGLAPPPYKILDPPM